MFEKGCSTEQHEVVQVAEATVALTVVRSFCVRSAPHESAGMFPGLPSRPQPTMSTAAR